MMKSNTYILKTITYSSLAVATIAVITTFLTATSYTQLGAATLIYPLLVFFAFKAFPREETEGHNFSVEIPLKPTPKSTLEPTVEEATAIEVSDFSKRAFLKMIGATGISFFLASLLNRRFDGQFFGKVSDKGITAIEDTKGVKVDPAQTQPTDGYRISEVDDNAITFYGFIKKGGAWFIMREDTSNGSFRYAKGETGFPTNWENRKTLTYDYYHNIF